MKLTTINKFMNLFLLVLVVQINREGEILYGDTKLYFSTVFRMGYVKNWPHIRLLTWLGL